MGTVQKAFGNGVAGTPTRSIDEIIISIKNASSEDIDFGAPVFLTENGAVPFSVSSPQDFADFLGFAVRAGAKTPDDYPRGQNNSASAAGEHATWHSGDVMEVLVRGSLAVATNVSGARGGRLYIRKSDGTLTGNAGASGSTLLLENCRIRAPRNSLTACAEVIVNKRNIL